MRFLTQIYRANPVVLTILFFLLLAALELLRKRYGSSWRWSAAMSACTVGMLLAILYTTVFGRAVGAETGVHLTPFDSYRQYFAGENNEFLRANFMNALLFAPFGMFLFSALPRKWNPAVKLILITLVGCGVSCGVEYLQFIRGCGEVEADDVIHNTLGMLIGGAGLLIVRYIFRDDGYLYPKLCKLFRHIKEKIQER